MSFLGTTVFEGDVKIKPNVQPGVFGAGDLEVCRDVIIRGNLTVEGEQSDHQVTRMIVEDNLTALNQPPTIAGRDGGIIISRHIDDFTSGPAAESGTAQAGATTTITLDASSNANNDYYNGWYIKITAGTGVGEIKEITDYDGAAKIATVDSTWVTNPDNTSEYELYNKLRVVAMFDESEKEFAIVATTDDHTVDVVSIKDYCDLHVGRIIQEIAQECIYYVGKHGNDSDSGRHINEAKLTFTAALAAASAELPSANNQIAIVCVDDCEYTEAINIPNWVHVYASNAKLIGTITLTNNSSVLFREQEVSSGTAITKSQTSGSAIASIDVITLSGTANGVNLSGLDSSLKFTNKKLTVEEGIAINNMATGTGVLNAVLCDVTITGTGTAVIVTDVGSITNLNALQITGTGVALQVVGILNAHIGKIDTTIAYGIASTGISNLFIGEISGTESVAAGGTSNRIYAGVLTSKGDILTRTTEEYIRHPVGTDGFLLTSDSATSTGLAWTDPDTIAAAINVQDESIAIPNTPHMTFNFVGAGVTAIDQGAGVARIVIPGGTGASNRLSHSLLATPVDALLPNLTPVAYFDWDDAEYGGTLSAKIFYNLITTNRTMEIQVYNETTATQLAITTHAASGFYDLAFTPPLVDSEISIRVRKTSPGGVNPQIKGLQLVMDPVS